MFFISRFVSDDSVGYPIYPMKEKVKKSPVKVRDDYSTGIQFIHQSTGRLPVTGCTNTHG